MIMWLCSTRLKEKNAFGSILDQQYFVTNNVLPIYVSGQWKNPMTFNLLNTAPKASLFMVDTTLKASKVGTWRSYPKTKKDMHAVCKPVLHIRTTT